MTNEREIIYAIRMCIKIEPRVRQFIRQYLCEYICMCLSEE